MSIKSTLDWLVKKVNFLLDQKCECQECVSQDLLSPNIKFNWGRASEQQEETDYYREVSFPRDNDTDALMNVYNLEVEISNFEDLEQYNPVLLIDRYKFRSRKDRQGDYRKAGYKHEVPESSIISGRPNEIPLNSKKEILNIGQENYFWWNNDEKYKSFQGRGMARRYNRSLNENTSPDIGVECYVHLGFRLRLTVEDKTIDTNHLGFLRMEIVRRPDVQNKVVTLTYRYV